MRPYIICHMMTSIDGRIDCAMTEHLPGEEYYPLLESLDAPTRVSGRYTAEIEMALQGKFNDSLTQYGKEGFNKAIDSEAYEVIIDTKGTLLWNDSSEYERPLLIVCSQKVSNEYLDYLSSKHISWIVTGKENADLKKACEILYNEFKVERMCVVGGGKINGAFLENGLLDEISILIGAGIDGRIGQPSVFDGLKQDNVVSLKLKNVKSFDSGAVWLRYDVK